MRNKWERRLRVVTWNISELCSERKQKEVAKNSLSLVRSPWEKDDTRLSVEGYKWFGIKAS